jgi:hypothetical protein
MSFALRSFTHAEQGHNYLFCICHGCFRAVMFLTRHRAGNRVHFDQLDGDISQHGVAVVECYPPPPSTTAPPHTPEVVGRLYTQAVKALAAQGWDAAGAMSRKALDVATRHLDTSEAFAKKTLYQRIEALEAGRKITPQMKEWAHAIRIDGNDAAHDIDLFSEEEATRLCSFTEMFLQYTFTMPGMLAERREQTDSSDGDQER